MGFFLPSLSACQLFDAGTITVLPLESEEVVEQNLYSDWTAINSAQSAHLKVFEIKDKTGNLKEKINILSLNKNRFYFDIKENTELPLLVGAWQAENPESVAVINGSFFDENYQATGGLWLKGQGKIVSLTGKNTYDGAVIIDENGNLNLNYLPQNNLNLKKEESVLVNFPMLINNGKYLLKENGGESARRSLIGEDEQFVYLINSTANYFTLYEMMIWVGQNIDGIENLLNLDGGSSAGLSVSGDLIQWQNNSFVSVPNVLLVYEKK